MKKLLMGAALALAATTADAGSWYVGVSEDPFDGNRAYAMNIGENKTSLYIREEGREDANKNPWFSIYWINGDGYICDSSLVVKAKFDDEKPIASDPSSRNFRAKVSTDDTAIFFGHDYPHRGFWVSRFRTHKRVVIRSHDGCGSQITDTFDISDPPPELLEILKSP